MKQIRLSTLMGLIAITAFGFAAMAWVQRQRAATIEAIRNMRCAQVDKILENRAKLANEILKIRGK